LKQVLGGQKPQQLLDFVKLPEEPSNLGEQLQQLVAAGQDRGKQRWV